MKFFFVYLLLACFQTALAIPNAVFGGVANAESPLDGIDLAGPLFAALRTGQELPGDWREEPSVPGTRSAYLLARPKVFDEEVLLVRGLWRDKQLEEIQLTFNDAGSYFGFFNGTKAGETVAEQRARLLTRQEEFQRLHDECLITVRTALEKLSTDADKSKFGKSRAIRAEVVDYQWDGVCARLFHGPNRLVRVSIRKGDSFPKTWLDPEVARMKERNYQNWLVSRVESREDGDLVLSELEVIPQGYRPYCGLNTLVMAGRYLGLHIDEDWLASAAGFQNTGSAAGSKMLSLYRSVATEAGVSMKRLNRFDDALVKRSLRNGLPVIVWRRWSKQRDLRHSEVTKRWRQGEPEPWEGGSSQVWPDENAPLHASVIVGFNEDRGEYLFLESWQGLKEPRRMPRGELAATAYLTFCFKK